MEKLKYITIKAKKVIFIDINLIRSDISFVKKG